MRISLLLAMAVGASFLGSNCGGSGVGDPCTPEDEYLTGFTGYSQSEVNVESRSFQCLTRICLVNHFQGRVSCPYGQVEDDNAEGLTPCMGTERNSEECLPGGSLHRDSCQVPDRDGARWEDRIVVPVAPQLQDRQTDDAVYCSCRCDGPDSGASYCECPSGFSCEPLVEDLGLGKGQLAGSYCVKEGTEWDPAAPATTTCNADEANCDRNYNYTERTSGPTGELDSPRGRNQEDGDCLPSGGVCGSDDVCCSAAANPVCIDSEAAMADSSLIQNCNGTCNGSGQCVYGEDASQAETIYEITRSECGSGNVCP